jgi:hypothetical protein
MYLFECSSVTCKSKKTPLRIFLLRRCISGLVSSVSFMTELTQASLMFILSVEQRQYRLECERPLVSSKALMVLYDGTWTNSSIGFRLVCRITIFSFISTDF